MTEAIDRLKEVTFLQVIRRRQIKVVDLVLCGGHRVVIAKVTEKFLNRYFF